LRNLLLLFTFAHEKNSTFPKVEDKVRLHQGYSGQRELIRFGE